MRTPLALGCLLFLGCGVTEEAVRLDVSSTSGGGISRLDPALLSEVSLGNETRHARCVQPGSSFEIKPGPGVRRLALSTGVRGSGTVVRFEVHRGDDPEPVLVARAASPKAGWTDHRVDLPEANARLRFSAIASDASPGERGPSACWGSVVLLGERAPGPPNVILVSLDTLGAPYLGSFGNEADPSPRIDAFLDESFSFRRAYVQFANTLTSHRAIFTSRYPSRQNDAAPYLAELLSRQGYATAAITENAYVGSAYGFARGFDRYVDGTGDPSTSVWGHAAGTFETATQWLEAIGRHTRFFLFVHTYEVHSPYQPSARDATALANRLTPDDNRSFDGQELAEAIIGHNRGVESLPEEDISRLSALYTGEIRQLDALVGEFLDGLDRLGLGENTLVVITSDHGEAFGEDGMLGHGKSLHGRVLHVPLGFRWEGRIATGASEAVVQSVDVLPTVLALTGAPQPPGVDGRDLSPLLLGQASALEPAPAFAEMKARKTAGPAPPGSPACVGGALAVFSERFKLYSCRRPAYERFYDLVSDPNETRDVSQARPGELERHRAFLQAYTANAPPAPRAEPGADDEVDPLTRERLRVLGYLD